MAKRDFALRVVALAGEGVEFSRIDPGLRLPGDLRGAIRRAGIEHDEIRTTGDRGEAPGEIPLLVQRKNENGIGRHGGQAPGRGLTHGLAVSRSGGALPETESRDDGDDSRSCRRTYWTAEKKPSHQKSTTAMLPKGNSMME